MSLLKYLKIEETERKFSLGFSSPLKAVPNKLGICTIPRRANRSNCGILSSV